MPATQQDAWLWIAGGSRDVVFDSAIRVLDLLDGLATVASELGGWLYQHTRDLTGFIDGTENPAMIEAPDLRTLPISEITFVEKPGLWPLVTHRRRTPRGTAAGRPAP